MGSQYVALGIEYPSSTGNARLSLWTLPAIARREQTWTEVTPNSAVPVLGGRLGIGVAMDVEAGTGRVLAVIPVDDPASAGSLTETWIFDPATTAWSLVGTTNAPPARVGAVMMGDGTRALLFGGQGATGYLNDTWIFDWATSAWSAVSTSPVPAPRRDASGSSDGTRAVLFGGVGSAIADVLLGDTWTWSWATSTWTSRPQSGGPTPRWGACIVADGTAGQTLLIGGYTKLVATPSAVDRNVWLLDAANKWQAFATGVPVDAGSLAGAMDPRGEVVLSGGALVPDQGTIGFRVTSFVDNRFFTGCSPLAAATNDLWVNSFLTTLTPGGALVLDVAGAQPLALYGLNGAAAATRQPFGPCWSLLNPTTIFPVATGTLTATGSARVVIPIPGLPAFVGLTAFYQAFVPETAGTTSITGTTNGTEIRIGF